ncbi:hypothetical protein [Methylobacterium iners]|uniref:Uncharacterized protein n=1 Tax=Methylobacterium iners TaxID=418707 RepID=A0ABQ4S4X3_9HYPH|nr:hypothetical protein [Methylobacterium iners]GJD97447.1 hypothetical protein OCOJLMKI_4678 [Methylobacterium iners]
MTIDELDALCMRVYRTPKWASLLAIDLSKSAGRPVSPAQVNQWQSEIRGIPPWVEDALPLAFHARYIHWGSLARGAREVSEELAARIALERDADLDDKPDMMPGM